jgi:hypothetical protein
MNPDMKIKQEPQTSLTAVETEKDRQKKDNHNMSECADNEISLQDY